MTKSAFPSSCPGKKLVSMTGKPTAAASAMVPGPAFVTNTSEAAIYSAMFVINPRPTTLTCPRFVSTSTGHSSSSSSELISIGKGEESASLRVFLETMRLIRFAIDSSRQPDDDGDTIGGDQQLGNLVDNRSCDDVTSHSRSSISCFSFSLRPQTTSKVASRPLFDKSTKRASTIDERDPTPSPPPITKMVRFSPLIFNFSRRLN
mmetsp:Transcript_17270/g.22454  ORF Transcript_17270/g.22454 Transcript_17270/m.22454 type:complete len:205 (+) Transcript_17270:401-1015(+)